MKRCSSHWRHAIILSCADEGILRAASADTLQRRHEIEDHDFFYELFKRLERNDKKIFVIAGVAESC